VQYENIPKGVHPASRLLQYSNSNCTSVLKGTDFSVGQIYAENSGFVNSIFLAYNRHHNLVIRPDDVWIAIATQFSYYVNWRAEEFRGNLSTLKEN